jgi:dipeptidyl aminopeptidase/acylaminoacyl peptidase
VQPVQSAPRAAPYGTWASRLTAERVAAASVRLSFVAIDDRTIYWIECRPDDEGRCALVARRPDGRIVDVTPRGANVRTRVHEYGGAAYTVRDRRVFYAEDQDQRIYELTSDGVPHALTQSGPSWYADLTIDPVRPRLVCVREERTPDRADPQAALVAVSDRTATMPVQVLVSGDDFYSNPRFSPDGRKLSWISWQHPQMPWDGTTLWVADLASDGGIIAATSVAGGPRESIFQSEWSPDGTLYFISDRSGWWNLYRLRDGIEPVCPIDSDFGRPLWQLGTTTWAFADEHRLVVTFVQDARWRLGIVQADTGALTLLPSGVEPADSIAADSTRAVLVAGSPSTFDGVVTVDLTSGAVESVRAAARLDENETRFSSPEPIQFPTTANETAYAFFYPPASNEFTPQAGERPPLIAICHGGPTAMANSRLNLEVQYWTSRGFAVVDVNYRGSTGYGRAYRQRLRGAWGVVDVEDAISAVRFLIARGSVDPNRLIIRGRSAGGFTALAALTSRPEIFHAAGIYYGVADLERLVQETHKFESRYLDGLIGPYPEEAALYRARSPIHSVGQLNCPVVFFQGLEDRVVPPDQSMAMVDAIRAKGIPVALVTFEGEQHGFRKAESIARCLDTELSFYGAVLGFLPAGQLSSPAIANIESLRRL